ncbi:Ycf66 family protein [Cyanobium sp. WAJ14-Wanaka]|uniref:Ycf66 family protein n=1 Tax=Cyanobium sp. WAJ14-Wanaka TaxID=2823725 RepID=UPI0020CBAACB|nr:Ycf66 family protein [Cyanobium sp. WAJ14-Wanaka]MCP9775865.1 hypothetical protein [Cyanobium sp. WAJ14-Wanaka]
MVATLGGSVALLLGLAVLLLPLLATELSRPRDSAWGAVLLLLGLVLVTSKDRLQGAPMLGVLCGGLLLSRLALEVGQGRWRQLSEAEQDSFSSPERWGSSLQQLAAVSGKLLQALPKSLPKAPSEAKATTKRWVRPEPEVQVVSSLNEVDSLLLAETSSAQNSQAG